MKKKLETIAGIFQRKGYSTTIDENTLSMRKNIVKTHTTPYSSACLNIDIRYEADLLFPPQDYKIFTKHGRSLRTSKPFTAILSAELTIQKL